MRPLLKKERHVITRLLVLWVVLITFAVPNYAYAYIDPATTTYIIQIVAAIIITVGVSFSIVIYRFRMLLTGLLVKLRPRSKNAQHSKRQTMGDEEKAFIQSEIEALELKLQGYVEESSAESPEKAFGFTGQSKKEKDALASIYKEKELRHKGKEAQSSKDSKKTDSQLYGANILKGRLSWLLNDTRSFKSRFGLAALVSASLVFMTLVFGPLELFALSREDMLFTLGDFLGGLLLIAVIAFIVLTVFLILLRGRLLDCVLCLIVGIGVACFIQASFFNGFIGQLTGDTIPWQEHTVDALVNLSIWLVVILVFFIIRIANVKVWNTVTVFISSLLIVVQIVALVSFSSELTNNDDAQEGFTVLSREGTLEVSSSQNVIVFLLDRLDARYIQQVKELDPNFFNELEGFTEYTNNLTRYSYTYPSIAYSLTGVENDYNVPAKEYFELAYSNHLFLDDLNNAGWNTKLYLDRAYDYGSTEQLAGRASNLKDASSVLDNKNPIESMVASLRLAKRLDQLSLFRYSPIGTKAVLWMPTSELSSVAIEERNEYSSSYQRSFMDDLVSRGLSASIEEPAFIYYHLDGAHSPFYLDSNGYPAQSGETDEISQTQGSFEIVYEYLKQLRTLGVYEDTCIIITGDHGFGEQTLTSLFFKPSGSVNGPLEQVDMPVSDVNLVASIVEEAEVESTAAAAEHYAYAAVTSENTPVREKVIFSQKKTGEYTLTIYDIEGSALNFDNWYVMYDSEIDVDYWMNPINESQRQESRSSSLIGSSSAPRSFNSR